MSLTPEPESIGYIVYITSWVCPVVTVPVFSLRIYAAVRIIKRWHWDDSECRRVHRLALYWNLIKFISQP